MLDLRIFCEADADLCLSRRSKSSGARLIPVYLTDSCWQSSEMSVSVVVTWQAVSNSGSLSSSPISTSLWNLRGSWLVSTLSLLSFYRHFYDDSTTSIVHLNNIEDKNASIFRSYLISINHDVLQASFSHYSLLNFVIDIIVPRGIENKVAISMSTIKHSKPNLTNLKCRHGF